LNPHIAFGMVPSHVDGFTSVTPAGRYCKAYSNTCFAEFLGTGSCFSNSPIHVSDMIHSTDWPLGYEGFAYNFSC
jgi:hypothetical protein